jgi:hydroxylamine reductase
MFCNQCEQTSQGVACTGTFGVCGKDEDIQSLEEMLLYGLKGMAAYANHARRLGKSDEKVSAFIEEALFATMTNVNFDMESMLELNLECGRQNLRVMEMLDEGHCERFGTPEPSTVKEGTQAGHGILMTGHDLLDLHELLIQCEGTDIKVYTHGEMLPAHMYPVLRDHPNLAGHYGGAWQSQKTEFSAFSGPVVATTNCILIPREQYAGRLFTTRVTAVPGGTRLPDGDYSAVVAKGYAPGIIGIRAEVCAGG